MARSKMAKSERRPSEVTDDYWLQASRKTGTYPDDTPRSGKWLVFVKKERLDDLWAQIKQAAEEGRLGDAAKTSTARTNANAKDSAAGVICVYTYDWTDEADVKRIREELRALGVTWKIPYKSDHDTLEGKYAVRGHTRTSKYYE